MLLNGINHHGTLQGNVCASYAPAFTEPLPCSLITKVTNTNP